MTDKTAEKPRAPETTEKPKEVAASTSALLVGPNGQRPIPIAVLRFDGRMLDIPGKSGATSVTASSHANRHRHAVYYLPWLRCFRIEHTPAGKDKPDAHLHVPESWCTYEPAESQAMVVKSAGKWHVMGENGKHLGGPFDSREEAEKRLREIEFFKANKGRK